MAGINNSHQDLITISITMASIPAPTTGFGKVLFLCALATNSLDGERVVEYASVSEAQAAQTAGFISAGTLAAVTAAFSQRPAPSGILVGNVDLVAPETYSQGLAAVQLVNDGFYAITADTRVAATQASLATTVQALDKIYVFQSADADWLTSGVPAAFSTTDGDEQSIVVYHNDAAEWADVAWAAGVLAFDPDVRSAPWDKPVLGVDAYTTTLTAAQKGFARANNANIGLPYSGATFFIDPGTTMADRPADQIVTAHWLKARIGERAAAFKVQESAAGRKIGVTREGQSAILAILRETLQQGVAAGHFAATDPDTGEVGTRVTAYAITSADRTARRLRFLVEAQSLVSARLFTFAVNLSLDPLG